MSRYNYDPQGDRKAVLPNEGVRLVFGEHRMEGGERVCKAWPDSMDMFVARPAFTRWIKGALKGNPALTALLARVKAGEVRAGDVAVVRIVRSGKSATETPNVHTPTAEMFVRDFMARHEAA